MLSLGEHVPTSEPIAIQSMACRCSVVAGPSLVIASAAPQPGVLAGPLLEPEPVESVRVNHFVIRREEPSCSVATSTKAKPGPACFADGQLNWGAPGQSLATQLS